MRTERHANRGITHSPSETKKYPLLVYIDAPTFNMEGYEGDCEGGKTRDRGGGEREKRSKSLPRKHRQPGKQARSGETKADERDGSSSSARLVPKRQLAAQSRVFRPNRVAAAREFFESARNLHLDSYVTLKSPGGKEGRVRRVTAEYILSEMPVKKVLENLAYYHDNMPDLLQDEEGATKPKKTKKSLLVNLRIGGEEFQFLMQDAKHGGGRQIFIGFTQKILDSVPHSYDDIVDELDKNNMSKTCATVILQALNQKGNKPLDWQGIVLCQKEAAMELMVLTHVAEAAVPLKEEVEAVLGTPGQKRQPGKVKGGIGGIGKTARAHLRDIRDGKMTFSQAFNTDYGKFLIARQKGKKEIKTGLYRLECGARSDTRHILLQNEMAISETSAMSDNAGNSEATKESVTTAFQNKLRFHEEGLALSRLEHGNGLHIGVVANLNMAADLSDIGDCHHLMGNLAAAMNNYQECLTIQRAVHETKGEDCSSEIAMSLGNIGTCLLKMGNYGEALSCYKESFNMTKFHGDGANHEDFIVRLNNLGLCHFRLGKYKAAMKYLKRSHEMCMAVHDGQYTEDMVGTLSNLGLCHMTMGNFSSAMDHFQQSLALQETFVGSGANHPNIALMLNNIGMCLGELGDTLAAMQSFKKSLKMRKSIHGKDAKHNEIAATLSNIGVNHQRRGDFAAAEKYCKKSLSMFRTLYGRNANHHDIAQILNNIGMCQAYSGNFANAKAYLQQSLDMMKAVHGEDAKQMEMAKILMNIGQCHGTNKEDFPLELEYYQKSLEMYCAIHGEGCKELPDVATLIKNIGQCHLKLGNLSTAKETLEKSLNTRRTIHGNEANHPEIAATLTLLGHCLFRMGDDMAAARATCEEALAMLRAIHGERANHTEIASTLSFLGNVLASSGDLDGALKCHEESLRMFRACLGDDKEDSLYITLARNMMEDCQAKKRGQDDASLEAKVLRLEL